MCGKNCLNDFNIVIPFIVSRPESLSRCGEKIKDSATCVKLAMKDDTKMIKYASQRLQDKFKNDIIGFYQEI